MAQSRFEPRQMPDGKRGSDWRVYDRLTGSFPCQNPELGEVAQDLSRADIDAECERLTQRFGYMPADIARARRERGVGVGNAVGARAATAIEDHEEDEPADHAPDEADV